MGTQVFDSIADVSNSGGWVLTGAGTLNGILQSTSADTSYLSCPTSSAGATISFPLDVSLPAGAVISSVSVMVRAATGPNIGSVDPSIPQCFTVDAITSDNTSRAVSRSIFPTGTITTYTLGTYTRDASGNPWDVERLNRAYLRVRCNLAVADALRIYRLYLVINYKLAPTVTVNNPTGTVTTPSPFISWTYSQSDGDALATSYYKIYTQSQVSTSAFDVNRTRPIIRPISGGALSGDVQSITLPDALPPDTYWVYVQVASLYGATSGWVGRQFTVSCPQPGRPGDALGGGSAGTITVVEDDTQGNAELNLASTSNLQSVQSASSANIYDGVDFITTNCTLLQDASTSFGNNEFASWKLTPSSSADAYVTSFWQEVTPGSPFTGRVQFKAASAGKSCTVTAQFADATFTYLSSSDIAGTTVTDSTTSWTEAVVTGTVPLTANHIRIVPKVISATSGAAHWLDHIGVMYGTNSPYSDGGMASRNMLSAWYATAEGTAPAGQSWAAASGCTADTIAVAIPSLTGVGNRTHRLTYNGLSPSIAIRATGTAYTSTGSSTAYTLNKPAGTLTGDLMLAYVSSNQGGTIHAPAGWTVVNGPQASTSNGNVSLWVLKRTAGASEPSSWTDGYLGTSATLTYAIVVSYSGAADASQQFIAEGSSQLPASSPLYLTNPSINNTDPNAWRASAFAVNSPTSGGTLTSNQAGPTTLPISYVGAATPWTHGNGNWTPLGAPYTWSYTVNKPVGVVSGDLMIATVAISGGATVTVTPPTGWTLMGTTYGGAGICAMAVIARTAGGSEPTSWSSTLVTGGFGTISSAMVVQCVAYRGADVVANQFLSSGTAGAQAGTSLQSPFVNNTDSASWSLTLYAADSSASGSWDTNESTMRVSTSQLSTNGDPNRIPDYITTGVADSNGSVGTGYWTVDGLFGPGQFRSACMFEVFIKSAHTVVTPGANETARNTTSIGTGPSLMTGVFDSNAAVAAGQTRTTGTFAPGSGSVIDSMVGWNGLIKPQTSQPTGIASMTTATLIDISNVDPRVLELCGNQVTVSALAAGASNAGTPYLAVNFYRASVLLSSAQAAGSSFGVYPNWGKGYGTFDIPEGTTRLGVTLEVDGRPTGDVVYFDKISLSFGSDPTFRNGTAQSAHPIWSVPQIQYADDAGQGFSDWADLQGFDLNPSVYDYLAGSAAYFDETLTPLTSRKYRARTLVYGLQGDQFVSPWSSETPAVTYTPSGQPWWLKDLTTGTKLALKVQFQDLPLVTTGTAMSFQPLGEDFPLVVTEGYKSDTIKPTLRPVNRSDWLTLGEILRSGNTLFLQSDYDQAWWVRPLSDIDYDVLASNMRQSNPIRDVTVTFLQVAPEA